MAMGDRVRVSTLIVILLLFLSLVKAGATDLVDAFLSLLLGKGR